MLLKLKEPLKLAPQIEIHFFFSSLVNIVQNYAIKPFNRINSLFFLNFAAILSFNSLNQFERGQLNRKYICASIWFFHEQESAVDDPGWLGHC